MKGRVGGAQIGSGRKSKAQELKEIEQLSELLPSAIATLRALLSPQNKNKTLRFYAAKLIIDKCVPETLTMQGKIVIEWITKNERDKSNNTLLSAPDSADGLAGDSR